MWGVGTTSPLSKLSIQGTAGSNIFDVASSTGQSLLTVNNLGQCVTGDTELPIVKSEENYKSEILNSKQIRNSKSQIQNVQIKDIKGGEMVLSLNEKTGKLVPAKINGLLDMGVKPIYKITTENGKTIRTTGNHPYLVKQKLISRLPVPDASDDDILVDNTENNAVTAGTEAKSGNIVIAPELQNISALQRVNKLADSQNIGKDLPLDIFRQSFNFFSSQSGELIAEHNYSFSDFFNASPSTRRSFLAFLKSRLISAATSAREYEIKSNISSNNSLESNLAGANTPRRFLSLIMVRDNSFSIQEDYNTNENNLSNAQWTRVVELSIGDEIVVANESLENIKFSKIVKIELLPAEQVYDIEVENTHNFVGNGIIAHNTYISGNVGIGTTGPISRLSVVSGVTDNSDVIAVSTSTSGAIFRVTGYGNVVADGTITGGGADYAEYFYSQYTNLMPGETVCIDLLEKNAVKRCYRGHDNNVMGIVSTKPSILGNSTAAVKNDPEHYVIIGMLGQVDAFVSAENGPINIGDSLTSASSTPGYAMRADSGDSTVGVALEPLAAGKGKIKVLISRRNKSLAVEEVEALVVERIANMKIEDQVQAMIKQAVDNLNLDPKIQAIAQQEANKLDAALTVRLDDVDGKIFNFQFSIGNEFSKINDQMNALASGLYITNSQGQVIFSGNREIGALPNREVALTADSILLNGNVGIGTTSPWSMLSVNGTITQTNQKSCSAGLTTDANGAINGCVASDVSLKIDIASSTYDALSIIAQLAPVNYKWRNSLIKDSLIHSGFIAQEVAAVFPTAVLNAGLDENGKMMLGVDPNAMASLLVKGLQELNNSVMALSSGLYITDSQGQAIFPNNLDIASTAKNIILNGNVGIGVSSPKFKLDVAGNINSTGLCLNGVCKTSWDQLSANFSDSNLQANSGSGALTQNFALDENGYLALGKIKASELKTQKLTMDNNTGEPAIGNGVIKLNATSTVVINKNIEAGSKIFITWRENLNGADFWICSQISKESFSVCLDRAAATSTPFDYWIVGVDENKNPPNPLYQGGIGETPPSQALSETPVPVAEQITPPALETSVSNTPAEIAPAEIQPPLPPLSGGSESAPAETAPQETPAPEAATITEQVAPALPPTVSPEAVPAPEASPVPAVDTTTGN